ncbi:nickel/cobalt ABC transporter permease [Lederbergia galactosidilytica]|uniref:Nickel transporter permease NikB n=1 Tax=Lederbergia galactosidilytica TaxID=217031 RepID=A0A177ZME1_9BACI|nr:nickel/cobalt ABC transporter permease [Lederbergia galactosidilytica]KRG15710.1 nickel transporter permease NikB [Virgibacillus soli]OAK68520.1 nickel transporter permease NikB [Lederbergia galactosidilytica]
MRQYVIKRCIGIIPLLLGISFLSFILINLSDSDPAEVALRVNAITPTEEAVEQMRKELGLDKPFFKRYVTWLGKSVQGDFGISYVTNKPVLLEMKQAIPATLLLAFTSLIIIFSVSLFIAVLCTVYEGSFFDRLVRGLVFMSEAIPSFWLGLLLMWLLAVKWNLFPTSGMESPSSVILPAITLAFAYISTYVRLLRNQMVEAKGENYVVYLQARGLKKLTILRHILKNSLQTSMTAMGMSIPKLIAGTVIIENIFAWPGVGRLCVTAIFNRDYPVIQAYVLLMAVLFVVCNLLVDLFVTFVDPRMRKEG